MQIRQTHNVSVFKVAFSSRLRFEGPKCVNGRAVSWHTSWLPERYALHYAVSLPDHVCSIPRIWNETIMLTWENLTPCSSKFTIFVHGGVGTKWEARYTCMLNASSTAGDFAKPAFFIQRDVVHQYCACKWETESENESMSIIVSSDLSSTHLKSDPNWYGWVCHQLEAALGKTGCHFWKGYPRKCVTNWPPRVRLSGTLYNSGQRGVFGVSNRGMYMLVCDTLHEW